jgi:mannosylglycerate hydrolase
VVRRYDWPAGLLADLSARTTETVSSEVRTLVEMRHGEPFVRLLVSFENRARDHRLRFHIPLPEGADRSYAEGQFAIVERGLTMEGGHGEVPLPTFPAHGLVAAGGATVLLEHVLEYEIVAGPELALTLHRATGLISRDRHPWRDEPAGPVIAAPSGQGLGARAVAFALLPRLGAVPDPDVLAALERYRQPFLVAPGQGATDQAPRSERGLSVSGPGVVLTSLRRRDDALELRLVNETDAPRTARIEGPFRSLARTDLLGRPIGQAAVAEASAEVALGPWEIVTLQLHR